MTSEHLLVDDTIWSIYESEHERKKYEKRIEQFLLPILKKFDPSKILEVGAGSGYGTIFLNRLGYDAHAVDPYFRGGVEELYPFLHRGSGLNLAFLDQAFDLTFSFEVIEHIGTIDGALELSQDYWSERERFIAEICRVTRKHVIITTPNKRFPLDEHGSEFLGGFRVHSPFEKETLSVGELEEMFAKEGFALGEFLNPKGYYALERVARIFGKTFAGLANHYLLCTNNRILGRTPLNPHLFLSFRRL